MKPIIKPYQLGMWLAQYGRRYCHICQMNDSQPIVASKNSLEASACGSSHPILGYLDKGILCQDCHNDISWLPKLFNVVIDNTFTLPIQPITSYEAIIRDAIIAYKYKADFSALPLLIHAIKQLPKPLGCTVHNSVIVPVPTTNKRLIKRGFDPVLILAKYLSHHWQIDIYDGVVRMDNTVSQQGLTREERIMNISNAFTLTKPLNIANILLFDDVATTGSTLKSLVECVNNTSYPSIISAYALSHGNS